MVYEIHRWWGGSCRGGVGHAEVEWGESYRGGMGHAVKQPRIKSSESRFDPTKSFWKGYKI